LYVGQSPAATLEVTDNEGVVAVDGVLVVAQLASNDAPTTAKARGEIEIVMDAESRNTCAAKQSLRGVVAKSRGWPKPPTECCRAPDSLQARPGDVPRWRYVVTRSRIVCVTVVDVRIMRMRMNKRLMRVFMGVWRLGILAGRMLMLMMLIMDVPVSMRDWLVRVTMHVPFGEVQP
jgi:hypothetical protein